MLLIANTRFNLVKLEIYSSTTPLGPLLYSVQFKLLFYGIYYHLSHSLTHSLAIYHWLSPEIFALGDSSRVETVSPSF